MRREGLQALWKGFAPQLLMSTPYSIIMFGSYQSLKPPKPTDLEGGESAAYIIGCALAGAGTGVAVTAVHQPLELWRVRVQTHLPMGSGADSNKGHVRATGSVLRS